MKKILLLILLILTSCTFSQQRDVMGTFSDITSNNNYKINQAYEQINQIENNFSIYNKTSEISILNKNKQINASNNTLYLIKKSILISKLSKGSFDITIDPLLKLYTHSFNNHNSPPTKKEIIRELQKVSYKNIIIKNNQISLINKASIDLGGIAKGYAIDKALQQLDSGIVNIGGDIAVKGKKDFTIALTDPDNTDNFITRFKLNNGCIATSGNYERYFNENKSAHHIMDPKTGRSAQGLISVTIIGDKRLATDCDALATAVFAMGKKPGIYLIESLDGFEAMIIDENRTIINSSKLTNYII